MRDPLGSPTADSNVTVPAPGSNPTLPNGNIVVTPAGAGRGKGMSPILTLVIGLVIGLAIAAGAFMVGMNTGQAQAQASTQQFLQQRGGDPNAAGGGAAGGGAAGGAAGGGGFAGRGGAGGAGAAGFTNGTVSKVNGNTFTVTVPNQGDFIVTLAPNAPVVKSVVGSSADLKDGAHVLVRGDRSGTNIAGTAVQITDNPAGINIFPRGGAGGGGRTRTPTAGTPTP